MKGYDKCFYFGKILQKYVQLKIFLSTSWNKVL